MASCTAKIVWIVVLVALPYIQKFYLYLGNDMNQVTYDVQNLRSAVVTTLQNRGKYFEKEILNMMKDTLNECSAKTNDVASRVAKDAIALYEADKTGRADFALQTLGGSIASTCGTDEKDKQSSLLGLGTPINEQSACRIIQASVLPGECWKFRGANGAVVIRLITKIYITGVSMEHIPVSLSPTGEIRSAPKDFSVRGMNCLNDEGIFLGRFSYHNNGSTVQYFDTQTSEQTFQFVELKIYSNHGDQRYTCVYRFRVHGKQEEQ